MLGNNTWYVYINESNLLQKYLFLLAQFKFIKISTISDRIGHLRLDETLSICPSINPMSLLDPAGSKLIRSRSINSAKSAFLCPSTNKVKKVRMAVATW